MITQRVGIQRGTITVTMKSDTKVLDEVVVTAQGLNRNKKRWVILHKRWQVRI